MQEVQAHGWAKVTMHGAIAESDSGDKVEDLLSVLRRPGIVIPSASCRQRAGFMVRLNTFIMLVLKLKVREEVNLNT